MMAPGVTVMQHLGSLRCFSSSRFNDVPFCGTMNCSFEALQSPSELPHTTGGPIATELVSSFAHSH